MAALLHQVRKVTKHWCGDTGVMFLFKIWLYVTH